MRETSCKTVMGHLLDNGEPVVNDVNFPDGDFNISDAEPVYEIPNPFPVWGATYILARSADAIASVPGSWRFSGKRPDEDFSVIYELASKGLFTAEGTGFSFADLPRSMKIAAARESSDAALLELIAQSICEFEFDNGGRPSGLKFERYGLGVRPRIKDYDIFKAVVANPALPDDYKVAMVLMPGIQGGNPIVGEYRSDDTHVWEYLRANSYIPWGHFASNMAHDSVRYSAKELSLDDVKGLRALYYQRIYLNMISSMSASDIDLSLPDSDELRSIPIDERVEHLRNIVSGYVEKFRKSGRRLPFNSTMWGWNYGFDMSQSGYRLHASNQQIHQQFALIPSFVPETSGDSHVSYAVGDHVAELVAAYNASYQRSFFADFITAIENNSRTDGRSDLESSLVIYEDKNAMLFVPKAQLFQAELQIVARNSVGHILEADTDMRKSLDHMIWIAVRLLAEAGAEMVTCFEMSARFDNDGHDQRIMYCFLPRHPHSPGSFSEHQGRWITGHYPEDVADSLRRKLAWLVEP
jgi:hypothetical protein